MIITRLAARILDNRRLTSEWDPDELKAIEELTHKHWERAALSDRGGRFSSEAERSRNESAVVRMCRNVSGQVSLETLGRLARALGDDVEPGDLIEFTPEARRAKRSR